jgi:chemotaxis protein MotB
MAEDQGFDPNGWMVTFSDLVMLLLTFFVLLLTMSSMDTKQLKALFTHFQGSTGVLELSGSTDVSGLANFMTQYYDTDSMLVIDQKLLKHLFLADEDSKDDAEDALDGIEELIGITDDERGIVISFQEDIFFQQGEAAIKGDVQPFLDGIAKAIQGCANEVLIMGHTDNVPVNSPLYGSNWELSLYRGLSVLQYLLKKEGISPSRFSVGGYGPSRPLYPNDTAKHRALNRRVEIIFKHMQEV